MHPSYTESINKDTIHTIENNLKLTDDHVMTLLYLIKKRFISECEKEMQQQQQRCIDIRIIDSQMIKLFMEAKRLRQSITTSTHLEDKLTGKRMKRRKIQHYENDNTIGIVSNDTKYYRYRRNIAHSFALNNRKNDCQSNNDNDFIVILPLNEMGHWSLLIYCGFNDKWYCIDSIKGYHIDMTKRLIKGIMECLIEFNEDKEEKDYDVITVALNKSKIEVMCDHLNQPDGWECGQFLVSNTWVFMECLKKCLMMNYHFHHHKDQDLNNVGDNASEVIKIISEVSSKRIKVMEYLIGLLKE